MRQSAHIIAGWGLGLALLLGVMMAQSGSSVETPSVPPHSGNAAGPNGPRVNTPPPPARKTTNPVNNQEDNSPKRTLTGIVSDSYCGRHHYLLSNANEAECTRYCIAHQARYVLVVGDRLYALQNRPGHVLDSLAGRKARVTGALIGGNVLEVEMVEPLQSQAK
ncbi:MAG: hypothetical protein JO249_26220 [Acidobacteria bacterium]|nr:hypothetical protein [Acidobacteriota bacterium]